MMMVMVLMMLMMVMVIWMVMMMVMVYVFVVDVVGVVVAALAAAVGDCGCWLVCGGGMTAFDDVMQCLLLLLVFEFTYMLCLFVAGVGMLCVPIAVLLSCVFC